jgi:hypothetical protein
MGLRKLINFPQKDIMKASQKIPESFKPYIIQTLYLSNQCYNDYMGRNHFSKHGGPYFINDGVSRHSDKPYIKPDKGFFYFIAIGFGIVLVAIGSFLYFL